MCVCAFVYVSVCVSLSVCLSVCLHACLPPSLPACLSVSQDQFAKLLFVYILLLLLSSDWYMFCYN